MAAAPPPSPGSPEDNHFAEVFSAALRRRNLPLQRIHARLVAAGTPVSVATLSYWQTGRSKPRRSSSLRVLAELEQILEMSPGQLVSAVEGKNFARWDPSAVTPERDVVEAVLEEFGLLPMRRYAGVSTYDQLVVGADRTEKSQLAHQLIRCETPTLDRIPVIWQQDSDEDATPSIEPIAGCRIGRQVQVPSSRLIVAEMLFPAPLTLGEHHHIAYQVHWSPTTTQSQRWERSLSNHNRQVVMQVSFQGEPPRRATRYYLGTAEESDALWPHDELPGTAIPIHHGELQAVFADAPLGVYGVAWQW